MGSAAFFPSRSPVRRGCGSRVTGWIRCLESRNWLRVTSPELIYDLPAGGRRMVPRAEGYRHTFVAGTEVMANGEVTGALPGRLIRGEQSI